MKTPKALKFITIRSEKGQDGTKVPVSVLETEKADAPGTDDIEIDSKKSSSTLGNAWSVVSSIGDVKSSSNKPVRNLGFRSKKGRYGASVDVVEVKEPAGRSSVREDECDGVGEHVFVGTLLWGRHR